MKKNQLSLFDEDLEIEKCIKEQKECADWLIANSHLSEKEKRGARLGVEDWLLAETLIRLETQA